MKLGIIGLPNVGKSTLFNSLTKAGAMSANYPFCTIDPNVGVAVVPDWRLQFLSDMHHSARIVPAVVEFVDIAGLVRGASDGAGLGNKFLSHIREVDAIVHVVRCFDDGNVIHVDNTVDPCRDVETINLELILSDIEILERRFAKEAKNNTPESKALTALIKKLREQLDKGVSARDVDLTDTERELLPQLNLLSDKPVLYAANVAEDDLPDGNDYVTTLKNLIGAESPVFVVCAQLEAELSDMPDDEKAAFLAELGIEKSGLDQIIAKSYETLGLISFLTAGPKETRAWTIKRGTLAPQAAGVIHSDLERGFIRAEVTAFDDLHRLGSAQAAKENGLVRVEGKEYEMKDGDVVLIRFNV